MWFAYIDESKDPGKFYNYTALITTGDRWAATFDKVKAFRQELRRDHGIFLAYELHAWKFVPGRGRPADRAIYKAERAKVFNKVMRFVASCGSFVVVSSCSTNPQYALERLVTRINNTATRLDERVLLFFDEGEEVEITKRMRKLRVNNPIPSNRQVWRESGKPTKNVPLTNILEDPIFKDSKDSYFIQLADFCAYALLRSERPIPSRTKYGMDKSYDLLRPATRRFISATDSRGMGIIRDKRR
jgi:hypothetical protein